MIHLLWYEVDVVHFQQLFVPKGMPKSGSEIKCEVQVRTLYEEVWGEVEHSINYPYNCESMACKEQLKVLAQLTAAGTRLADSIITSKGEYDEISRTRIEEK